MKITSRVIRQLSSLLLPLHAADDEVALAGALRSARKKLQRKGSAPVLAMVEQHAELCGEKLRARQPAAPAIAAAQLTSRELEVLQHIALGLTDATIGRSLGIATKTVSKHVENILRKLRAESRTAAATALHSTTRFS